MRGFVVAVAVGAGWLFAGVVVAMVLGPQMRRSAAGLPFGHRNAPVVVPATPSAVVSAVAGHRRRHARGVVPAGLAAVVFAGSTGLAAAGALPGPVQGVAHTVLGSVGVSVPEVPDWSWTEMAVSPPSGEKQRAATTDDTGSKDSKERKERKRWATSTSEAATDNGPVPEEATSTPSTTVPTTSPSVTASIGHEASVVPRSRFRNRAAPTEPVTEPVTEPPLVEEPPADPLTTEPPPVDPPDPTHPPVEEPPPAGPPDHVSPPAGPPVDVKPPAGPPDHVSPPAGPPDHVSPGGPTEKVGGGPGHHGRRNGDDRRSGRGSSSRSWSSD